MRHRQLIPSAVISSFLLTTSGDVLAATDPGPDDLVPCPYTIAEVAKDLGLDVEAGIVSDVRSDEVRDVGCVYPVKNSFLALAVRQVWDVNATPEPVPATAGSRSIAGDPDRAVWLADQTPDDKEDKPHIKLKYKRGKVSTSVDLYGSYFKKEVMAPKLEKLRRVP